MLKWAFASLLGFLGIIVAFIMWRTGYFKEVTIGSGEKGPLARWLLGATWMIPRL